MHTLDRSQAVEWATETAHERTVEECDNLGLECRIDRGRHVAYTEPAQNIFDMYYDQEWTDLGKRYSITVPQTPELTEQEQHIVETIEEGRKRELYELCRDSEREQTKENDGPALSL